MNVTFRSLFVAGLLLLSASLTVAQTPVKPSKKATTWYLDKKQKEFYTPTEAKKGKFQNEKGQKLVKATQVPAGFKPTDDFKKTAHQKTASAATR